MSEAQEALADVRGWLCDNLNDGDAGEICGMLSVVSRHINELETENITLQATKSYLLMNSNPTAWELRRVRIEWRKDRDENAKLRELVADMWFWGYCGHMDSESQEWQMKHIDGVLDRMRGLGIEANK